jgi:hypothetical protein
VAGVDGMDGAERVVVVLGFALHAVLLPAYLASGLVVPALVVPALVVAWVLLLLVAIRNRRRPWLVLGVPVVGLAVLVGVVSAGSALFDWTA